MNKIILTFLIFLPFHTYGDCLNDINNESDLLLSNICNYEFTILAKIESVSLKNKYNPFTYFKNHRVYTLNALVKEPLKGNIKGTLCFVQWREEPFDNVYAMENNMYIISFNNNKDCSVIEVGSILKASEKLLKSGKNEQAK